MIFMLYLRSFTPWRRLAALEFNNRCRELPEYGNLPSFCCSRVSFHVATALELSDFPISPRLFALIAFATGCACGVITYSIGFRFWVPLATALGLFLPFSVIRTAIVRRASRFAEDFPTVLLAMASALKSGLPPYQALERAVANLPESSLVKCSVERLLSDLSAGISSTESIKAFAPTIDLPDLEMFRTALQTVVEHGGQFSPALERIALISRERVLLVRSARVTTSIMRMTGNILLVITPIILTLISARTPDFWSLIQNHPTASPIAALGGSMIIIGLCCLHEMGHFKP